MRYIKINTSQNINEFSFIEKNIFLIKNNLLFLNDILIKKGDFSFFGIYNEQQLVFDEDNFSSLFYNHQGKLINEISDYALRHIFTFTNGNSVVGGNDGKNIFYGIYDFTKNKMIKRYDNLGLNGISQVLNDNLFISKNKEKIGVFNFENTCVWEKSYKELFTEYEPIGAGTTNVLKVKNKLYVELDKTYCINIETGKTEQIYNYKFTNSENEFLYGLQFLSMTKFQLAILNTVTNNVKLIDVSSEFNKLNVYPDNRIVTKGGLVYFSQNMGDNIAKIGILCPKTAKILWKYDFEKQNGMIGTLKVNGNRIYAHTQDQTLHIFEKQQTTIT